MLLLPACPRNATPHNRSDLVRFPSALSRVHRRDALAMSILFFAPSAQMRFGRTLGWTGSRGHKLELRQGEGRLPRMAGAVPGRGSRPSRNVRFGSFGVGHGHRHLLRTLRVRTSTKMNHCTSVAAFPAYTDRGMLGGKLDRSWNRQRSAP